MKTLLTLLLLSVMLSAPLSAANGPSRTAVAPPSVTLPLLRAIQSDAIEIGRGPVDVYVFVDPNCPHSRDFLDMISGSEKMRTRYHYYFFLYALPHFESSAVINAIYSAASPRETMLSYMLKHKHLRTLSRLTPPAVQAKVLRISNTARRIGIDKRPYIILDKKKKP